MSGLIDTAYVEIESRSEKFETGATKAFDDVEKVGQTVAAAVERAFAEMSSQLVHQFEQMRREADMNMDALITKVDEVGHTLGHEISQGTNAAERGFDELRRSADRDLEQIERRSASTSSSVRAHFGGMSAGLSLPGPAMAAGAAIAGGLGMLTSFGLKSAATLEQTQVAMSQLTGSAESGQKVFKDLQQFAAATPFEFNDLTVGASRFLAFSKTVGMSQQQLLPFMTTIGNLVSETGGGAQSLDTITLALGQTASQGKLTLGNLDQINNALPGFSSVAALAAVRGESTAKVMDEISKGSIDATTGVQQLLQGMQQFPGAAGAMEKQSQTLLGVFSTFKDTVSQALAGSFAPAIPAIKDTLTQITPILGNALGVIGPALGTALSAALPLIGQLVQGIVPILTPLIDFLGKGLTAIGPTLAPLGQALGTIASAIAPILPVVGALIGALATGLTPIIAALAPVLVGLTSGLMAAFMPLLPVIVQVGQTIGAILLPVSQILGAVFAQLGPIIGQLVAALGAALAPLLAVLGPLFVQLITALMPLLPALLPLAAPLIQIVVAMMPLVQLIAQLLVVAVAIAAPILKLAAVLISMLASQAVGPLLMLIANALTGMLAPLTDVVKWLEKAAGWLNGIDWGGVGNAISGAFSAAWDAVSKFFSDLGQWFANLPGNIMSFMVSLPGMLGDLIATAFNAMFYAIGFGIGLIIGEIAALPGQIAAFFSFMWEMARTLTVNGVTAVINFVTQLPGRLANIISSAWNWVVSLFRTGSDNAVSTTSSMIDRVISFVTGLPGRIGSALGDAGSWLVNTGHDIIAGLIKGIENAIGWAVDVAKNAMGSILKGAKDAIMAKSPSRKFADEVGKWIPHGVAVGIEEHADVAVNAISNVLSPATTGQLGTVGGGVSLGAGAIVINMNGDVTQQQAYNSGTQAGQGFMDILLAQGRALAQRPRTV